MSTPILPAGFTLRHTLKPGDPEKIVRFHATVYGREYGFDARFAGYVAGPLADFVQRRTDRERLWIVERDEHIVGCVAIVAASERAAQLRWFLVDSSARGRGLGKFLLQQALDFSRDCGFEEVFLWTADVLKAAAQLYSACGFRKIQEQPSSDWGVDLIEEKYVLSLRPEPSHDEGHS